MNSDNLGDTLSRYTQCVVGLAKGIENSEIRIYLAQTLIVDDNRYLFPMNTQFTTRWMVYRNRAFGMMLQGKGSAIMINKIDSAIAEV